MGGDREYLNERWKAHRREHALEHRALEVARSLQESALELARHSVDHRLDGLNALRQEYTSDRANFLTIKEYDAKHEILATRMSAVEHYQALTAGRDRGLGISWTVVLSIVSMSLAAGAFIDKVILH